MDKLRTKLHHLLFISGSAFDWSVHNLILTELVMLDLEWVQQMEIQHNRGERI